MKNEFDALENSHRCTNEKCVCRARKRRKN
jgi:hypothetical protein